SFRVRSPRASRLEVHLFARPRGEDERLRVALDRAADGSLWSAEVALADLEAKGIETIYYGLRAWGPNWPYVPTWTKGSLEGFVADVDDAGNRFNPNKLLYDPYALELSHDPFSPEPIDGTIYELGEGNRQKDSGAIAPKGIVLRGEPGDAAASKPTRALASDVVYEVHVRGLTMQDPSVPPALRGTYAGAALKAKYLRDLGVTAIELLPIHETQNEQNDDSPSKQNYWGYASNSFFAPDRRYAADKRPGGPTRELRSMVSAFHAEGIKVFVDVVYNHTGEGGSNHLLSWRGLDARGYYEPGEGHHFADNNGVGPNFHPRAPIARQLVMDSLAYYAHYLGVDGFRFDLAAVLGDRCESYCFIFDAGDPGGVIARAVEELPARSAEGGTGVDLIAEPWAIGLGTYQVGGFPAGWSEWNDHFRDTIRKAQNRVGVEDMAPRRVADGLGGSPSLYGARTPSSSVNFVTAHDGFTLRDLYTYGAKQNEQPPPFGPSTGGTDDNISWDQGGDPAEQTKAARTAMLLLAVSAGVPMVLGGDELSRTQRGNNNAYNLDNVATWLDWSDAEGHSAFRAFTRGVLRLRGAHPALRPTRHRDGADHDGNGLPDVALLTPSGEVASASFLDDSSRGFVALRIDGEEAGDDARSIYVAYNWSPSSRMVTLPTPSPGRRWNLAAHSELGLAAGEESSEAPVAASVLQLAARSAIVLLER
ncbi:MAG: glycogen-debranching protein, partial [Labilithrix sp.]|nr:glycogen-debranching protein [Labilithrix sp.]